MQKYTCIEEQITLTLNKTKKSTFDNDDNFKKWQFNHSVFPSKTAITVYPYVKTLLHT